MMKKQPTATQQKLIDNGADTRVLTIRYESTGSYNSPTRRETVKTVLPDLGDGHATFRAGRETYHVANGHLYIQLRANLSADNWNHPAGEIREWFHLSDNGDKTEAVNKAYDREYGNAVIVNDSVVRLVDNVLYAHLTGNEINIVNGLDETNRLDGNKWTPVIDPLIGSWRVPLIHAAKLRDAYRLRMNSYGVDGDLAGDETANIPFNDETVEAALAANAEGAQWGVDTGVYVPTTEEMDAADALNGAFRGVEDGYGKVNTITTARRIADALAAYDAARENVTIL